MLLKIANIPGENISSQSTIASEERRFWVWLPNLLQS